MPQGKFSQDLVAVLLPVHRDHEHALLERSGPEYRSWRCQQLGAVREGQRGSSFVNALHLTDEHLLFRLRLRQREHRGEAKHCDQACENQLLQ